MKIKITYLVTMFIVITLLASGCLENGEKSSTVDGSLMKQVVSKKVSGQFDGQDISGAKQVVTSAANALTVWDMPTFNSYLSNSTNAKEDFNSLPQDRATTLALAFKNAKVVKIIGIGIISWEMTIDGKKLPFMTIMEEGTWKIL